MGRKNLNKKSISKIKQYNYRLRKDDKNERIYKLWFAQSIGYNQK
jgi:hypothetical protein